MPALVFDLGGTHLRCAVMDGDRLISTASCRIQSADEVSRRDDIWRVILQGMTTFANASAPLLHPQDPIVISFPGPIAAGRHIVHAPTVCGCSTGIVDLAGLLEARTGRPVHLLNDLSAAAWFLSKHTSADRFMVVTVSSGIGSKIFDRRHASCVLDEPVYAGEIGHMVVDEHPDALRCDCGGVGHLGGVASGRGVERTARLRAGQDPSAFLQSCVHSCLGASPDQLTNEQHLVPAALAGDAWTLQIIRDCTRPLARVLLAAVMSSGLEQVFVIGGFAQALGSCYLSMLQEMMLDLSQYTVVAAALRQVVRPGDRFGSEPCLLGCAAYLSQRSALA